MSEHELTVQAVKAGRRAEERGEVAGSEAGMGDTEARGRFRAVMAQPYIRLPDIRA
jgi:hypothetical protein